MPLLVKNTILFSNQMNTISVKSILRDFQKTAFYRSVLVLNEQNEQFSVKSADFKK